MPLAKDAHISERKKRRKKEINYERKEAIKRNCTYRQCNYVKETDCVADCYSESGKTFVHKKEKNENEKKKKIVPQWDF